MKVLLTGGSGFIGKKVVERLSLFDYDVLILGRNIPRLLKNKKLKWVKADLSNQQSYKHVVEEFAPEIVIHLAWQDIPDFSFKTSLENQISSITFLDLVTRLPCCKKILVSGSCWEFNQYKDECVENKLVTPQNYFTWAKNSICHWLQVRCKERDIAYAWFRIFFAYGPGQRKDALLPQLFKSLINRQLPVILTPLDANDFIFVEDIAEAFLIAINKKFSSGIYNLGSGSSTRIIDFSKLVEGIVSGSQKLSDDILNKNKNKKGSINFWASTIKTKTNLGWEAKTSLIKGVKLTLNQERF